MQSEQERVCVLTVCVAAGLSDEISIAASTQAALSRCMFQSQRRFQCTTCAGCLCTLLFMHCIIWDLREDLFTVLWKEHGSTRTPYPRLWMCSVLFSLLCAEICCLYFFLTYEGISLAILRKNTLICQKVASMELRFHSASPLYQIQILQSAIPVCGTEK